MIAYVAYDVPWYNSDPTSLTRFAVLMIITQSNKPLYVSENYRFFMKIIKKRKFILNN